MVAIFYCWFGGHPLPSYAQDYIRTWRAKMPKAQLLEINERNFDVHSEEYVSEAYEQKKFAFVSDYARLNYLLSYGGIYLDTDVEMRRALSHFAQQPSVSLSMELYDGEVTGVNAGTIVTPAGHPFIQQVLESYRNEKFPYPGGHVLTLNERMNRLLKPLGFSYKNQEQILEGIHIYPYEYFCTDNASAYTVVHDHGSSWREDLSPLRRIRRRCGRLIKGLIGRDRFDYLWNSRK